LVLVLPPTCRIRFDNRFLTLYHNYMKDEKNRAQENGVPEGCVIYKPEEPLYETVSLCGYMSDLCQLFRVDSGEESYSSNTCAEKE
jgi:hypothetical protein